MTTKIQAITNAIRKACPELHLDTRGMSDSERVWEEATATPDIHLEHVLRALGNSYAVNGWGEVFSRAVTQPFKATHRNGHEMRLDLTKSFSENMQDEALVEWLYKILVETV